MIYVQLLRQEADRYRALARQSADTDAQEECEDLAAVMEEVAAEVEDRTFAG